MTNQEYVDKIHEELPEISKDNIFVEPSNKETATCIGLSAVKLLKRDKEAVMVVLPSDHYIEGEKQFLDTLHHAIELAQKKRGLITIGVTPNRPETGYGYIEMGDPVVSPISTFKVARFTEKPNVEVAKDFILKGTYLWNSGMFIWRADVFLREMQRYLPKMYGSISEIYRHIDEEDDIGTFAALSRFLESYRGNNISDKVYLEASENCSVFGGKNLVIGFGVKDLVIVDAGDVILVMDKSKDQEIKHLLNGLKEQKEFDEFL